MLTETRALERSDLERQKQLLQDLKFGRDNPTSTVLKQSIGPCLFHTVNAFQDAISVFFMARAYPDENASGAISSILFVKTLIFTCAVFFSNGITIQLATLLSQHKMAHATQLLADSLRLGILLGLLIFLIVLVFGRLILKMLAIPDNFMDLDYRYLVTCSCELPFVALFDFLCAALQGEGRATLASTLQITALLSSNFISDPIFMFACHAPTWSLGFSVSTGKMVISFILLGLFLSGKFSTKLEFKQFFKCFTKETATAVKVGVLPLAQLVIGLIPAMLVQSTIVSEAKKDGLDSETSSIFGIALKVYLILVQSATGALSGLYGCVSWAYSKRKYGRIKKLMYSSWIIAVIPYLIICPIMIIKPSTLLQLWISDEKALEIGDGLVQPMFYCCILYPFLQSLTYTLTASTKSVFAITPLVVKAIVLVVICICIAEFLGKPTSVVYCLMCGDIVGLITAIITFRIIGRHIWKGKDADSDSLTQPLYMTP